MVSERLESIQGKNATETLRSTSFCVEVASAPAFRCRHHSWVAVGSSTTTASRRSLQFSLESAPDTAACCEFPSLHRRACHTREAAA
ncbi:unnamed protein product, partial [Citrullus colocynthis]